MSTFKRYNFALAWALALMLMLLALVWAPLSASAAPIAATVVVPEDLEQNMMLDSGSVSTGTTSVYLPHAALDGFGLPAAWSAGWWMWIEAMAGAPLEAEGEIDCSQGQDGDVWFIAGTGGGPPVARSGTAPAGKTLFMPLFAANWANEGEENLTIGEKRAVLAALFSETEPGLLNSKICNLTATVNGAEHAYVRLLSPPFAFGADPEAVADGYYFALRPEPGVYEIAFGGALCDFDTDDVIWPVNVNLTLTVEADVADE